MTDVEVRFASNSVSVPSDDIAELARRLEAEPNGQAAADELREDRRFANDEQKQLALEVIETWMVEVGASSLSDGIMESRYELMRDLRLPPFNT